MTDRLIKLILNTPKKECVIGGRLNGKTYQTVRNIAEHLVSNGVMVPPCKVGDTVWWTACCTENPQAVEVTRIQYTKEYGFDMSGFTRNQTCRLFNEKDIGEIVFLAKEEAEKALEERSGE